MNCTGVIVEFCKSRSNKFDTQHDHLEKWQRMGKGPAPFLLNLSIANVPKSKNSFSRMFTYFHQRNWHKLILN